MIETNNVCINLHPAHHLLLDLRELVYERGDYVELTEEEKLETLVDWFVTHGNRCFKIGQKLSD